MLPHNAKMQQFLKNNGITCVPKYINEGSCKGQWCLYGKGQTWYGNKELQDKLTTLGFKDHDYSPLNDHSGNGGAFQVFVRFTLTTEFVNTMNPKERQDIMLKIDIDKTEYKGIGFTNVKDTELKALYEKYPKWDRLTLKEKQHLNMKMIAAVSLEEYLAAEYGGSDVDVIKKVTEEHAAAVSYVNTLNSK